MISGRRMTDNDDNSILKDSGQNNREIMHRTISGLDEWDEEPDFANRATVGNWR